MNLLTNAIYHTARGTVQVELSIGDADDPSTKPGCGVDPLPLEQNQINLEINQPMRWLQIRVSDTGCGVEDKLACFESFVSGRASVGLGLYLVKQHCMALGGSCGVTDTSLGKIRRVVLDPSADWQETFRIGGRCSSSAFTTILQFFAMTINKKVGFWEFVAFQHLLVASCFVLHVDTIIPYIILNSLSNQLLCDGFYFVKGVMA